MSINEPSGFIWEAKNSGDLEIFHNGILASTLRGETAAKTIVSLNSSTTEKQQQILARITGNYKHGNERQAKSHPRNQ